MQLASKEGEFFEFSSSQLSQSTPPQYCMNEDHSKLELSSDELR